MYVCVCECGYRVAICAPWVAFLHSVNFDLAKCCAQLPPRREYIVLSAPRPIIPRQIPLDYSYSHRHTLPITRTHTHELPRWTESGWRWQVLRSAKNQKKKKKKTRNISRSLAKSGCSCRGTSRQASGWAVDVDVHVEVHVYYVSFSSQHTVSFVFQHFIADPTKKCHRLNLKL